VRLHIKGTAMGNIQYGSVYLILGSPQLVSPPLNPDTLNYQSFLKQDKIYYQQHISAAAFHQIGYHPPSRLQAMLYQLRQFCQAALTKHIHNPHVRGIVLALVLGVKEELDELLRGAYAGAGTMHVLAVSGLHVGILYGLLSFLVYRRRKSTSNGWVPTLLICLGLWIYAGVTGLTPSVLRAAWMLSLVALAKVGGKKGNIYNVLATSAFVLLLWNPLLMESVSFQLSYLAVWGIVYLQPKIYNCFRFKNFILRHLWMWTSISLAAQITTTPISLYYFHQFPVYFIIANWVVVPGAFLIFSLGVAVLLTSGWEMLNVGVSWLLEQVTILVNQFVVGIHRLPYSVVEDMYMDKWQVGLWYGALGSILVFCYTKTFRSFLLVSIVIFSLATNNIKIALQQRSQQGIVFYSVYPHEALAFVQGTHSFLLMEEGLKSNSKRFNHQIKPHLLASGIAHHDNYTLEEAIRLPHLPWQEYQGIKIGYWGGKRFIMIDQPGIQWPLWNTKIFTDYLIIKGNSINSLGRLLAQFECGTLVIGSSNRKRLAAQLQVEARQLQINSHYLFEQGALQVDW
jgi:competence protein ComEC